MEREGNKINFQPEEWRLIGRDRLEIRREALQCDDAASQACDSRLSQKGEYYTERGWHLSKIGD